MTAEGALRTHYETNAARGHTFAGVDWRLQALERLLPGLAPAGGTLLDVGCGVGALSVRLGTLAGARRVLGVDISEAAVAQARAAGIEAKRADLDREPLPFPDASADLVFSGDVVEHLVDPDRYLREIRRVLRPEGRFVCITPNLAYWANRAALLLGYQPLFTETSLTTALGTPVDMRGSHPAGHLRVYTYRGYRALLAHHGFATERVVSVGCTYLRPSLPWVVRALDRALSRRASLGGDMIFVARPQDEPRT